MTLRQRLALLGRGMVHRFHRRPMTALALSLAVALAACPASTGQAARSGAPSLVGQLDTYLTGLAAQSRFSGAVLVARRGTVLLSKGYGLADREHKVPNSAGTRYPVGGVSASYTFLGALWLEQHAKLTDQASICTYLSGCPVAWLPITLHMVLDGTSQIPNYEWGQPSSTTAQSVRNLEAQPLDGTPGSSIDYQNGDVLVLATIIEKVSGEPWATFLRRTIFGPAGMTHSGRMTDDLAPRVAQGYTADGPNDEDVYNDYFFAYGTAPDVYAYDETLFGGRLVSRATLARLFGHSAATGDLPSGYTWQMGRVAGHQAVFTSSSGQSFTTINLRFVQDGVTIIVISNDDTNKVPAIGIRLASLVFR